MGVGINPIEQEQNVVIDNEKQGFIDNIVLFQKMSDYLKECMDCYEIIEGMSDRRAMEQEDIELGIQMVGQSRYLLGELYELYRIYDIKG